MNKITIYSTPTCPYCEMVKRYLDDKKIAYTVVDVSQNEEAAQKLQDISGQLGVPVIQVNDKDKEQVVVGFDKDKIDQILGIK